MRAIMVMFDSLRLDVLPCYGGKEIPLPNFERLAARTAAFENSYVASLPCMPARRELHTGRYNFLHRGWGPLEPFDDSMPELLKQNGIYTRLVTDHNHYVEDGGGTYHPRYSTWECNRGQEGDPWQGSVRPLEGGSPHTLPYPSWMPQEATAVFNRMYHQDIYNREAFREAEDYPQAKTFAQGLDFIEKNAAYDNWFLQIETFDPHEPFDSPDEYISRLFDPDSMSELDWPPYSPCNESQEIIDVMRKKYLALVSFCDESLGKVLDLFDTHHLWEDTMLIVNTDHGFLLGEHDWWAKSMMPEYQEIAHTPLFIWDPRCKVEHARRGSLVQTIDLAPTLLDFFGIDIPKDMLGKPLGGVVADDTPVRQYGIFGAHGGQINVTDGEFVYMLAPKTDGSLYNYTLMTTHMRSRMSPDELSQAVLVPPLSFTKGCPVLKIPAVGKPVGNDLPQGEELLYNIKDDPAQKEPLNDPATVERMRRAMVELLMENDAPAEFYPRYGLEMTP